MKALLLAAKILMHASEVIEVARLIVMDRVSGGKMCAQDYVMKTHLDALELALKKLEAL